MSCLSIFSADRAPRTTVIGMVCWRRSCVRRWCLLFQWQGRLCRTLARRDPAAVTCQYGAFFWPLTRVHCVDVARFAHSLACLLEVNVLLRCRVFSPPIFTVVSKGAGHVAAKAVHPSGRTRCWTGYYCVLLGEPHPEQRRNLHDRQGGCFLHHLWVVWEEALFLTWGNERCHGENVHLKIFEANL